MPFCIWLIFKQAYLAASRCCLDDQIRAQQERSRSECGMRSGGFPGAELAGCSQPQGTALTLSAALVMFSPSCKCLSHPWGGFPSLHSAVDWLKVFGSILLEWCLHGAELKLSPRWVRAGAGQVLCCFACLSSIPSPVPM